MAFQQGLSGLASSSKSIDVTSNNIANTSTVGFKAGSAQFSDVFASALTGATSGVQVGIGSTVNSVKQAFTQGNLSTTNNPLDLAINGGGFFVVGRGDGTIAYSRNGQFDIDKNGFVVSSIGDQLFGFQSADELGGVPESGGNPVALVIPQGGIDPRATANVGTSPGVSVTANLDARSTPPLVPVPARPAFDPGDATTFDSQVATFGISDAAGDPRTVSVFARRPPSGLDEWEVFVAVDGVTQGGPTSLSLTSASPFNRDITIASDVAGVPTSETLSFTFTRAADLWSETATFNAAAVPTAAATFPTATAIPPLPVSQLAQFDPDDPSTYNSTTSLKVFDSLGGERSLTYFFVRESETTNNWQVHASLDGGDTQRLSNQNGVNVISFDQFGRPVGGSAGTRFEYGPVELSPVVGPDGSLRTIAPLEFTVDLGSLTQFGSNFSVTALSQNGFAPGEIAGIAISRDGIVQGRYTNGQTRDLAQVALATFRSPNGLNSLGNNLWSESPDSGPAIAGRPGSGLNGVISSGLVEESNVDLTQELVNLIIQQRNYQANAQSIRTQDQILQTLVNLR